MDNTRLGDIKNEKGRGLRKVSGSNGQEIGKGIK